MKRRFHNNPNYIVSQGGNIGRRVDIVFSMDHAHTAEPALGEAASPNPNQYFDNDIQYDGPDGFSNADPFVSMEIPSYNQQRNPEQRERDRLRYEETLKSWDEDRDALRNVYM
jgi:hypothetical protein